MRSVLVLVALASLCVMLWGGRSRSLAVQVTPPPETPAGASVICAADGECPQQEACPVGEACPADEDGEPELVRPEGWPDHQPLPLVASNCTRCHLTAGRELTAAVVNLTRSVHDLNYMSCNDCHGGNTEDDVSAHEEDFGFIGTKLSAHLAVCTDCHGEVAEVVDSGPHAWDWQDRINLNFPMCVDCHGNHDIGSPPADFMLVHVCQDCHEEFEDDYPEIASVVEQNDKLWQTLGAVQRARINEETRQPEELADEIAELRQQTMQIMHGLAEIDQQQADELNQQSEQLRVKLQQWLSEHPPAEGEE